MSTALLDARLIAPIDEVLAGYPKILVRRPSHLHLHILAPRAGWSAVRFIDNGSGWRESLALSYIDGDVFATLIEGFAKLVLPAPVNHVMTFDQEGSERSIALQRAAGSDEVTLVLFEGDAEGVWGPEGFAIFKLPSDNLYRAFQKAWTRLTKEGDPRAWMLGDNEVPGDMGMADFKSRHLPDLAI